MVARSEVVAATARINARHSTGQQRRAEPMAADVREHESCPAIRECQVVVEVTAGGFRGLASAGDVVAGQRRSGGRQQRALNLACDPELPPDLFARRPLFEQRLPL
jgi:hypothetical protein